MDARHARLAAEIKNCASLPPRLLDEQIKAGTVSRAAVSYIKMSLLSEKYGWTPREIREQYSLDMLMYDAVMEGQTALYEEEKRKADKKGGQASEPIGSIGPNQARHFK